MNPSSELISEFKVAQFNNNAEFSQLGDITITTNSVQQTRIEFIFSTDL